MCESLNVREGGKEVLYTKKYIHIERVTTSVTRAILEEQKEQKRRGGKGKDEDEEKEKEREMHHLGYDRPEHTLDPQFILLGNLLPKNNHT